MNNKMVDSKNKLNIFYYIIGTIISSLALSIFTVFNDTISDSFSSALMGIALIGLIIIEVISTQELEKTEDFGVNFIAANILVIFPIIGVCFILFCIVLKIIFFRTL